MANRRGFNPIWSMVDLTGNQLDDNYYLFVLENDLPYSPETVYQTKDDISTPWDNPIQFRGNGTLPNNIYWPQDVDKLYRLEVRRGDTMSDPLIYLVENYNPRTGSGSSSAFNLATDNQVTNPQFVDIDFNSPLTLSGSYADPVQIGNGWELVLTGSGSGTVTQVAKNSAAGSTESTNAPYSLRLTLSGYTGNVILRQRFNQNGNLWAGKYVANTLTAKTETGTPEISARLKDSNNTVVASVLAAQNLTTNYTEYTGTAQVIDASNADVPPSAYVDYEFLMPGDCDIYVTSFQLISSGSALSGTTFEQTTTERQIDQTFHVYRDSFLLEAKGDILTGWDFGLNPWQSRSTTQSNLANNSYVCDQTIVVQQNFVSSGTGNNVSVGRASHTLNYGLTVQSVTADNQFAIIQYIDPNDARPYWGKTLSSYAKLTTRQQGSSNLRVKARLLYRSSLPPTIGQNEPIASWSASGSPSFAGGWSSVAPINDPAYNMSDGENELYFDGFELPASNNANMTLAIVLYTIDPMIPSGGTPDNITFNKVNLIPNSYASDSVSLTFEETLERCQRFYQKSFPLGTVPAQNAGLQGAVLYSQVADNNVSQMAILHRYPVRLRGTPTLTVYNPEAANAQIRRPGVGDWTGSAIQYNWPSEFTMTGQYVGASGVGSGNATAIHFSANARLGK